MKKQLMILALSLLLLLMVSSISAVRADGGLIVKDSGAFIDKVSSSLFTGMTSGETIIESTTIYQTDDPKILWGFPLNVLKVELIRLGGLDGENSTLLLDKIVAAGKLGDSDTFYLSAISIDHPYKLYGGGFLYDPSHFFKDKIPMRLGLYCLDTGRMLGTMEAWYELAPGYFLIGDFELGMESAFNRDYADGKIALRHNMKPDGTYYVEVGYMNRVMDNYIYFGAGVKLF